MSTSRKPDIFIAGSPRSGTTILNQILCKSAHTNPMMGEAQNFFNLIQAYNSALGQFDYKTRYYFTKDELFQYHKKLADDYLNRIRSKFSNNVRLVLKCPGYSKQFPYVLKLIPHSQFVMIIRDPLDIVASQVAVGETQRATSKKCEYPREHIQHIAHRVNLNYSPILNNKKIFGDKLHIIKYEKFVSEKSSLKRLSEFLQLPDLVERSQIDNKEITDFVHDKSHATYSQFWDQNLTTSSVGRYKNYLTPQEIEIVKNTTKNLRQMFHYD